MRNDLIPDNEEIHLLDDACKGILDDPDIGFVEKVFGFKSRMPSAEFVKNISKENSHYLRPHNIRIMVHSQLI